ncbi:MAG TPA: hypothetical protein PLJ50_02090, partial [Candidatus Latescibacteria bacterium]|nr:hypothetical protein [Candidatus Latescibacterota bacterium]
EILLSRAAPFRLCFCAKLGGNNVGGSGATERHLAYLGIPADPCRPYRKQERTKRIPHYKISSRTCLRASEGRQQIRRLITKDSMWRTLAFGGDSVFVLAKDPLSDPGH